MFKISDDLEFDDEFLDTEINSDFSVTRTHEDRSLANVNKVQTECHVRNPTHPELTDGSPSPSSVTSTPGAIGFVPKLKRSPALQGGKQTTGTENSIKYSRPDSFQNDLHPRDKLCIRNSDLNCSLVGHSSQADEKPSQSQHVPSHNRLFDKGGRSFSNPRSIPVALNTGIQANNTYDAPESPFEASSHQSFSHSEFLAEWDNNNFFNAEPKERTSLKTPRPNSITSIPNHSKAAEAVTRKINKTVRQRKFPGPAGLLPPRQGCTSLIAPEEFINELKSEESDPAYEETELLSQSSGSVFEGGAWSAMLDDLGTAGKSLLKSMNLASIKSIGRNLRSYKVPFLAVLVQSVDTSLPDAAIGFKDPTGEMYGVVHRDVWDQFSSDIAVGTVLVLRNVGIMSAGISSRQHVVNITGRNLTAIYSPKDELNIQLRQIHAFAASSSSKLLEEWEKVEYQNLTSSPLCNRIKKPPLSLAPFNNSRPRHTSPNNNINLGQSRFIPSPGDNPRLQRFNSPMRNNNPGIPRFASSSPNTSAGLNSSPSPFTPMSSRLCDGHSVRHQPPPMQIQNASHSSASVQRQTKSPCFAIKAPSSSRTVLPESSHEDSNIPPAPNINSLQQQSRHHTSTTISTIPIKKPKVCQNEASTSGKVTGKSNPFQVNDTSAVDHLLEGIDTDYLFGDF